MATTARLFASEWGALQLGGWLGWIGRTSVEMIEKYYASCISTSISAAAVNVRRKVKSKKQIVEHAKRNAHRG